MLSLDMVCVSVGALGKTPLVMFTPKGSHIEDLSAFAELKNMDELTEGVESEASCAEGIALFVEDDYVKLDIDGEVLIITADKGFVSVVEKSNTRARFVVGEDIMGDRDPNEYLAQYTIRPMWQADIIVRENGGDDTGGRKRLARV